MAEADGKGRCRARTGLDEGLESVGKVLAVLRGEAVFAMVEIFPDAVGWVTLAIYTPSHSLLRSSLYLPMSLSSESEFSVTPHFIRFVRDFSRLLSQGDNGDIEMS